MGGDEEEEMWVGVRRKGCRWGVRRKGLDGDDEEEGVDAGLVGTVTQKVTEEKEKDEDSSTGFQTPIILSVRALPVQPARSPRREYTGGSLGASTSTMSKAAIASS